MGRYNNFDAGTGAASKVLMHPTLRFAVAVDTRGGVGWGRGGEGGFEIGGSSKSSRRKWPTSSFDRRPWWSMWATLARTTAGNGIVHCYRRDSAGEDGTTGSWLSCERSNCRRSCRVSPALGRWMPTCRLQRHASTRAGIGRRSSRS